MKEFKVTFQLSSSYENSENDKTVTEIMFFEANNTEEVHDQIDDDFIDSFDDTVAINFSTEDRLVGISIDYILIEDENENVVYRDEEFKNK
jgi:hypothetical protein|tara:strand:+ start:43 stop:315 length:273 start_codon:yes stop_codon:yes gene_type:complete